MDIIRLSINPTDINDDWMPEIVDIFINGRNIIDIVREVELPFAEMEGYSRLAGKYMGLQPDELISPYQFSNGKIAILQCDGFDDIGCWPLCVRATVKDNEVIWDEFEQPHRNKDSKAGHWKYNGLRFVFNRQQYENELLKCKKS
jgi:hypothetical protein